MKQKPTELKRMGISLMPAELTIIDKAVKHMEQETGLSISRPNLFACLASRYLKEKGLLK